MFSKRTFSRTSFGQLCHWVKENPRTVSSKGGEKKPHYVSSIKTVLHFSGSKKDFDVYVPDLTVTCTLCGVIKQY